MVYIIPIIIVIIIIINIDTISIAFFKHLILIQMKLLELSLMILWFVVCHMWSGMLKGWKVLLGLMVM